MKSARVEQNLCIGCGLCCSVCDEVFRINEHENQEVVQEAIDSCPVSAIVWND